MASPTVAGRVTDTVLDSDLTVNFPIPVLAVGLVLALLPGQELPPVGS